MKDIAKVLPRIVSSVLVGLSAPAILASQLFTDQQNQVVISESWSADRSTRSRRRRSTICSV